MPGNAVQYRDPKVFWLGLASGRSLHIILYNGICCFRPNCIKKKWSLLFYHLPEDLITGGDVTADLASHAMFSLLLVVLTDIDDKNRKTVLVRATINEDITKRCSCFVKIS